MKAYDTLSSYGPIFMLFAVAAVVALAFFLVGALIGKKNPTPEKLEPYECGSPSDGARHVKPSVKFYFTAILFVVFDVEAVFIYPWAIQFRSLGWAALATMLTFLLTLALALAYVYRKGALEWAK
jgi:NADH-quinone oxidoreductase subunit A